MIRLGSGFFDMTSKTEGIFKERKNCISQTSNFKTFKRHHQENVKITHGMGENIWKSQISKRP